MNADIANQPHIVVAGGGFAGLGAAYAARQQLGPAGRVTLIEPSGFFVFGPSMVWAALGRPVYYSSFPLDPVLAAKGIGYIQSLVQEVRVSDNVVLTGRGEVRYDRLIIATGGRPDANAIPGLAGEFRSSHWVVGEESAMEAHDMLRDLYANPGPVVIGAAQGASYFSAAYEIALALDTELRRRQLRDRVPLSFVTAEPYLGELGFGQTAAQPKLAQLFHARNISYRTGATIERVGKNEITLGSGETLSTRTSIIMPPFTGSVDIWKSAKLTNDRGFIPVNREYRHVDHPAVYAAGVDSYFEHPIPPLPNSRPPHTGYLSLRMGQAAGENAVASLGRGRPASRTLPYILDVRVLDGGTVGLLLASWGTSKLSSTALELPGILGHYGKLLLERYLIWRLRSGNLNLP